MRPGQVWLTAGEVAKLFEVNPRTVNRWALTGRLRSIRTPGGHRRFRRVHVESLLRESFEGFDDTTIL